VEVFGARGSRVHHNRACQNNAFTERGDARSDDNVFAFNGVTSSLPGSIFVNTRGADSSFGPLRGTSVIGNAVLLTGADSEGFCVRLRVRPGHPRDAQRRRRGRGQGRLADAPFNEDFDVVHGGRVDFEPGGHDHRGRALRRPRPDLRLRAGSPAVDSAGPVPDIEGAGPGLGADDGDRDGDVAIDRGALERPSVAAPRGCR
jgi:hypothetical protein